MKFRRLRASEIDARVSTVTEKGCSLLLYKDARVDMSILDETVGPLNWERHHHIIGDRLYCTVSIFNEELGVWVGKQDVGTESNTEKEKGQASDSFKRACFNWGIGRELYTAPFIWIPRGKVALIEGGGKYKTFDRFVVDSIGYDEEGNINRVVIRNTRTGDIVYQYGKAETEEEQKQAEYDRKGAEFITEAMLKALRSRISADKVSEDKLCQLYKTADLGHVTCVQYSNMNTHWEKIKESCHE